MADVSGLVIGTIALASLFNTCIDLFDRFELGRNYVYDYELACTKLSLLKARLLTWGSSLQVESPGYEDPALRRCWTFEQVVVGRSLLGIRGIFENAALLATKYNLTPGRSPGLGFLLSPQGKQVATPSALTAPVQISSFSSGWSLLRKRTSWAIHDKQKFDRFIDDLSFLIDNLEKVTERIKMPTIKKESKHVSGQVEPGERSSILPNVEYVSKSKLDKHLTQQPLQPATKGHKHAEGTVEPADLARLALQMSGHLFTGDQHISHSVGIKGNIGKSNKRNIYTGNQIVDYNGLSVMGDVSDDAVPYLREPVGECFDDVEVNERKKVVKGKYDSE